MADSPGSSACDLLHDCIRKKDIAAGRAVCSLLVKHGLDLSARIATHLIRMFSACGSLAEARLVFHSLPARDLFNWCAIISAHSKACHHQQALDLYSQMLRSSAQPDGHVFAAALQACAGTSRLSQGQLVHAQIIEGDLQDSQHIGSTLLHMYSRCGSLLDAHKVFDSLPEKGLVTWSAMISEYAQHGCGWKALDLFNQMQYMFIQPDSVTLASILKACSSVESRVEGSMLHSYAAEMGLNTIIVVGNALIDMYVKCGSLEDACRVFTSVETPDVVTWSTIIAGYALEGLMHEALQKFREMQWSGVRPNEATFLCILSVCSAITAVDEGNIIHTLSVYSRCELDVDVGCALVYMYMRCGNLMDAQNVFGKLPYKTVITWNVMIEGLARQGEHELAVEMFNSMQSKGMKPDEGTFLSLLSACSNAGSKDGACNVLNLITQLHKVSPSLDQFNNVVDVLGRAGFLKEAEDLLLTLNSDTNLIGWLTLLGQCGNRGNVLLARRCFDQIMFVDCNNSAAYTLMSNIYFQANMWEDLQKLEDSRNTNQHSQRQNKSQIFILEGYESLNIRGGTTCVGTLSKEAPNRLESLIGRL